MDGAAQETSSYNSRVRCLISNISNSPIDLSIFLSYSFHVYESFRAKRSQPPTTGNGAANKKGRGVQNQLVNRAFEGLSHGGRGSGRGRGRGGRARGRGWGGYY